MGGLGLAKLRTERHEERRGQVAMDKEEGTSSTEDLLDVEYSHLMCGGGGMDIVFLSNLTTIRISTTTLETTIQL